MAQRGGGAWAVGAAAMVVAGFGTGARAGVSVDAGEGWELRISGVVNAFVPYAKWHQGNDGEATTRVTSGFNPSKLTTEVRAPRYGGLEISGHFQFAPTIQSNKAKFAGNSIEARIAEISIRGSFGTIGAGRSWSIFNSQATIHDTGSGLGVGRIPSPDRGGPTFGRIGTGYTYTDFDPRIMYTTPELGGFALSLGLFDPIEQPFGGASLPANTGGRGVGALETRFPRLEAETSFARRLDRGGFALWLGGLVQGIRDLGTDSSTVLAGADAGGRLDLLGLAFTAAYSVTRGAGASGFQGNGFVCDPAGCRSATAQFWYLSLEYTVGDRTTIGLSTGQGNQRAKDGFDKLDNRLHMLFVHHKVTTQFTLMLEYQRFQSWAAGTTAERYDAVALGAQYDF
jgi:hypothetical protein